jgi:hypothetical protein
VHDKPASRTSEAKRFLFEANVCELSPLWFIWACVVHLVSLGGSARAYSSEARSPQTAAATLEKVGTLNMGF